MQMVIVMKVNGWMIKLQDLVNIIIQTGHGMKDNGIMINNMYTLFHILNKDKFY